MDLNLHGPQVGAGVGADLNVKAPSLEVKAPKVKADSAFLGGIFGGGKHKHHKAELNVQAPSLEVNAPKVGVDVKAPEVNVGAKVGDFFDGIGAGIGGLFSADAKGPKAELNVQAPTVDLNVPKAGIDIHAPKAGAGVDLHAPKFGVDLNAPRVGVEVSAPKAEGELNAPKVGVEAKAPEVNVGAKVGDFFEGVGAGIGGLFSASAKAPKAELNVQAPVVNLPKAQAGLDLNVQAPRADVQFSGPKLVSFHTKYYHNNLTIYS